MKIESVYREILTSSLNNKKEFTQKNLAEVCGLSISTVNYSLIPLQKIGGIAKKMRGFYVTDPKKILLYWASIHKMEKNYETHYDADAQEIESFMPSCLFTAYSGAKFYYTINPSDYSEVFVYGDMDEIKKRFPFRSGITNIICLKCDEHLMKHKKTPIAQIFVDLWNLNTWYAKEFLKEVEGKINEVLERCYY